VRKLIFDHEGVAAAESSRKSVVAKAQRSSSAKQNDATRRTPEDLPVQSFENHLQDMATLTLTRNSLRFESSASVFKELTESTPLQRRALELFLNPWIARHGIFFKDS
jgi:hypothetical protein